MEFNLSNPMPWDFLKSSFRASVELLSGWALGAKFELLENFFGKPSGLHS
jgi:hypothetical protein